MEPGKAIRLRAFPTLVPPDAVCASSCALGWLGGVPRVMAANSFVGFHAASRMDDAGNRRETGAGNALVGAYLTNLGLSEVAVFAMTMAAPDDIVRLDSAFAEYLGIAVEVLEPSPSMQDAMPPSRTAGPAATPGEVLANTDIPGGDLRRIDRTTFEGCQDACRTETGCLGLAFDERNRVCFLKHTIGPRLKWKGTRSWIASGAPTPAEASLQRGVALSGVDLSGADLSRWDRISFDSCRSAWERDQSCRAITYNRRFRACFLKSGVPNSSSHPDAVSWVKP